MLYESEFNKKSDEEKAYLTYRAAAETKELADRTHTVSSATRLFTVLTLAATTIIGITQCNQNRALKKELKTVQDNQAILQETLDEIHEHIYSLESGLMPDDEEMDEDILEEEEANGLKRHARYRLQ